MKKRLLSLLLAIVMVLSVFPMTVFAANGEGAETELTEQVEEKTEPVEELPAEEEEEIPEEPAEETESVEKTELVEEIELVELPVSKSSPKEAGTPPAAGNVCKIGETGYTSLSAAFAAATGRDTITLIDNATISHQISLYDRGNITLDLNGNTITSNKTIYIQSGTSLTVKDSSNTVGAIVATGTGDDMFRMNGGTLTIKSGTFNFDHQNYAVVRNSGEGSKVVIDGGTFTVTNGYLINDYKGIIATVKGGTFAVGEHAELFSPVLSSDITVLGGTFTGLSDMDGDYNNFVSRNQSISVQGGTYDKDVSRYCATDMICKENGGIYEIAFLTAGERAFKLTHNGEDTYGSAENFMNAVETEAQDGDTITLYQDITVNNMIGIQKKITLNLNNHKLIIGSDTKDAISVFCDLSIKNGTIQHKKGSADQNDGSTACVLWFGQGREVDRNIILTLDGVNIYGEGMATPIQVVTTESGKVNLTITAVESSVNNIRNTEGGAPAICIGDTSANLKSSELKLTGTGELNIDGSSSSGQPAIQVMQNLPDSGAADARSIIIDNPNVSLNTNAYQYFDGIGLIFANAITLRHNIPGSKQYQYKIKNSDRVDLTMSGGNYFGEIDVQLESGWYPLYEIPGGGTPPTREDAFNGNISGGKFSGRGPSASWIAEGYESVRITDKAYPELWYEVVKIKQVVPGTATVTGEDDENKQIEIKNPKSGDSQTVAVNEKTSGNSIATVEVADRITETLRNDNVSDFEGTKINANTDNAAIKTEMKNEWIVYKPGDTVTLDNIDAATNILKQITVDLTAASVEIDTDETSVKQINSMTFKVKPIARTTVRTGEGKNVTFTTEIPNEPITEPLTFRLFVDENVTSDSAAVYHTPSEGNPATEKEYIGIYPIQTAADGKKFIELSAKEFSFYTYQTIDSFNNEVVCYIPDGAGNYTGYTELTEAIAAADGKAIILLKDIEGTKSGEPAVYTPFDFGSKTITLDLNGKKLIGSASGATGVTVISSGDTKNTLGTLGIFANDVSGFVTDGYAARTPAGDGAVENSEVFSNTANDVFTVKVVPVPGSYTDRDSATADIDLYAGDTIKMDVRVYGAKFVGADVTLYYDKTNFQMIDAPTSGWDGDVKWYEDDASKLNGKTRFYAAKSTQGGASSYYELNKTDDNGTPENTTDDKMYYSLGTFEFEALPGANEAMKVAFQVEPTATGEIGRNGTTGQEVAPVYVAGAWSQGWDNSPANKLTQGADDTHLVNALVNVRLKSMSAVVNGETGLVYNATARNLVKSGAGAKDSITQQAIENPTIKYAVLTKAEVEGTLKEGKTDEYVAGKEPKVPADGDYKTAIPQKTDAGDYVVFYRVSKDGYITVADKLNVSIAKKDVDLSWTFGSGEAYKTGDDATTEIVSDFYIAYTEGNTTGYTAPTATYPNAGENGTIDATVTLKSFNDADPAAGTQLIKVGKYVYTATVDSNYNIKTGETKVVEVTGAHIEGYTLTAKGSKTEKIGNVWYDDAAHTPAQLNVDVDDPTTEDVNEAATADVTIKYHTLAPGATEWTVSDTIPEFTTAGTYQVKAVLTKDSYYDLTLDTVTFTIKAATYVVEKFDWVTGWDVVLVYTNDIVPGFTYDGAKMYDVSALGYKYGTTKNADGTVGTQGYTHVFGLVVAGDADITKVTSSNETALDINYSTMEGNMPSGVAKARLDVNSSSSVELLDLVFVQGVYNVNETYMAQQMAIVLKSDVNGDKMVDTRDCALIKANS